MEKKMKSGNDNKRKKVEELAGRPVLNALNRAVYKTLHTIIKNSI